MHYLEFTVFPEGNKVAIKAYRIQCVIQMDGFVSMDISEGGERSIAEVKETYDEVMTKIKATGAVVQ